MYQFGDVILANVQFTDTFEIKKRPALVLFQEYNNIVLAGITSNIEMKGIKITKEEGMLYDSIVKLNYIFTISESMIEKKFFSVTNEKKKIIKEEFIKKLN